MIVKALVKSFSISGVTGYVYKDVNIPVQTMLNSDLQPFERVELGFDALAMPLGNRSMLMDMNPLSLDVMPEADRGLPGLVVAATQPEALEMIVDHWIVGNSGRCDAAVIQAREARAKGIPFLSSMVGLLAVDNRSRRMSLDEVESELGLVWSNDKFFQRFSAVGGTRQEALLPEASGWRTNGTMGVVMEHDCRIGNVTMRRFAAMVPFGRERTRKVMVSFGGEWQCESVRRIDPDVLNMFNKKGRAVYIGEGDLTGWQAWKAVMLVKVPERRGGCGSDQTPDCLDGIPVGRLADARMPIPVADDVRVVESPAAARDILCRASRGFIISGLSGDFIPQPVAKLRGRWLALCVPSHWAVAV
ncbi:MAG TPA: hypothetical protein PKH54_10390 [Myxococcota bacterium]|nr:hypothetical protein [Myxococcota bacterium]